MPINASGPVSIGGSTAGQSINLEFGRAATAVTSMSQLYRGGGIVPNATANNAIPTSGAISLNQFYGATNRVAVTVNITTNQTNYVFNTAKVPGYVAGITDVTFNIGSGVVLSASSTGVFGGDVDTSWSAGDTILINSNGGFIVGMGGAGGLGMYYSGTMAGSAGSAGGPALRVQRAVSFNNAGTIGGGGGGGGGGAGATDSVLIGKDPTTVYVAGGGGGGGRTGATNSAGGTPRGNAGTFSSAGAGGGGATYSPGGTVPSGSGGNGGGWGAAGAAASYAGGGAGAAVVGNANITWIATGTRLGAIT